MLPTLLSSWLHIQELPPPLLSFDNSLKQTSRELNIYCLIIKDTTQEQLDVRETWTRHGGRGREFYVCLRFTSLLAPP
jgi:hypothetical protein